MGMHVFLSAGVNRFGDTLKPEKRGNFLEHSKSEGKNTNSASAPNSKHATHLIDPCLESQQLAAEQ